MPVETVKKIFFTFFTEETCSRTLTLLKDGPKWAASCINYFGYTIPWKLAIGFSESIAKTRRRGNLGVGALALGMIALFASAVDFYLAVKIILKNRPDKNSPFFRQLMVNLGRSFGWFLFNLLYTGGFELVKFLVATGWITYNPAIYATVLITSPWIAPIASLAVAIITAYIIADNFIYEAKKIAADQHQAREKPKYKEALLDEDARILCTIITHILSTFGIVLSMFAIGSTAVISSPIATMISTGITCGIAIFYLGRAIYKNLTTDREVTTNNKQQNINDFLVEEDLCRFLKLPNGYLIGTAVDNGDCFFDALAQALNQIYNTQQHTIKTLRLHCHNFYRAHKDEVDQWNEADYQGIDRGDDYYFIQYTKFELDRDFNRRPPIWGRPEIEGRMLCHILQIPSIHLIELQPNPDGGQIMATHFSITAANREQQNDGCQYDNTTPIIVIAKNHFVPILQCSIGLRKEHIHQEIVEFLQVHKGIVVPRIRKQNRLQPLITLKSFFYGWTQPNTDFAQVFKDIDKRICTDHMIIGRLHAGNTNRLIAFGNSYLALQMQDGATLEQLFFGNKSKRVISAKALEPRDKVLAIESKEMTVAQMRDEQNPDILILIGKLAIAHEWAFYLNIANFCYNQATMEIARAFVHGLNEQVTAPPLSSNAFEDHDKFMCLIGKNPVTFTPLNAEGTYVKVIKNETSRQTEINVCEKFCLPLINRKEEEQRPTMSFLKKNLELQFSLVVSNSIVGGTKQVINETPCGLMRIASYDTESTAFFRDLFSHRPFQKEDVIDHIVQKLTIGATVLQKKIANARSQSEYYQLLLSNLLLYIEIKKHPLLDATQRHGILGILSQAKDCWNETIINAFIFAFEWGCRLEGEQKLNTVTDLLRLLANSDHIDPMIKSEILTNPALQELFIPAFYYAFNLREDPQYSTLNDLLRLVDAPEIARIVYSCPDLQGRIEHHQQWILRRHRQHTSVQNDGSETSPSSTTTSSNFSAQGCPVTSPTLSPKSTIAPPTCSYSSSPQAASTSSAYLGQT